MTILSIFSIDDIGEENAITSLNPGSHIIGRGDLLKIFDKRVSRKHAIIDVSNNQISITPVHVNPCFFKAANGSILRVLDKDQKTELDDGDQIGLLADNFWFKVKVKREGVIDQEVSDIHNDSTLQLIRSRSTSPIPNHSTVKRSHENDAHNAPSPESNHSNIKKQKLSIPKGNEVEVPSTSTDKNTDLTDLSTKEVKQEPEQPDNSLAIPFDIDIKQENDTSGGINTDIANMNVANCVKSEPNDATTTDITNTNPEKDDSSKANKNEKDSTDNNNENSNMSASIPIGAVHGDPNEAGGVTISNEEDDGEKDNGGDAADKANVDKDAPSGSGAAPPKSKRERCWYGPNCYRKNPIHRQDFSHPGDDDYNSDPDDDRPDCPFGGACYRRNLSHRRQFKHPNRPAPRPINAPHSPQSPTLPTPKRKRTPKKPTTATNADESDDDDYDYDDPFINDDESDEYIPSQDLSDESESEIGDSQEPNDEESQERKRMLKEAKKFTKGKK